MPIYDFYLFNQITIGRTTQMTSTYRTCSDGSIRTSWVMEKYYIQRRKIWRCFVFPAKNVSSSRPGAYLSNSETILDLASVSQTHNLYLTLLTLLFSYSYDARSTQHDPSTESAWTICVLTPAFAALDPPPYVSSPNILPLPTHQLEFELPEIASVLTHSYRRAMAFPLYRSFAFAEACRSDIAELLLKGKRTVVRCLLEMKDVLDHHDIYHVYSKIWVDDFCVWAQAYARSIISL